MLFYSSRTTTQGQYPLISRIPNTFNHIKISLILFEKFTYLCGFQIGLEIWWQCSLEVKKMLFVGTM